MCDRFTHLAAAPTATDLTFTLTLAPAPCEEIAIVHEKFTVYAGSERVVEQLHLLWPDAPIFTTVCDPRRSDRSCATPTCARARSRSSTAAAITTRTCCRCLPLAMRRHRPHRLRPRDHEPPRVRQPRSTRGRRADRRVRAHARALDVGAGDPAARDRRHGRAGNARRLRRDPAAARPPRRAAALGRRGELALRRRPDPPVVGARRERRRAAGRHRVLHTAAGPPGATTSSSRGGSSPTSVPSSRSRPRAGRA